jgi:hypothetical protein
MHAGLDPGAKVTRHITEDCRQQNERCGRSKIKRTDDDIEMNHMRPQNEVMQTLIQSLRYEDRTNKVPSAKKSSYGEIGLIFVRYVLRFSHRQK